MIVVSTCCRELNVITINKAALYHFVFGISGFKILYKRISRCDSHRLAISIYGNVFIAPQRVFRAAIITHVDVVSRIRVQSAKGKYGSIGINSGKVFRAVTGNGIAYLPIGYPFVEQVYANGIFGYRVNGEAEQRGTIRTLEYADIIYINLGTAFIMCVEDDIFISGCSGRNIGGIQIISGFRYCRGFGNSVIYRLEQRSIYRIRSVVDINADVLVINIQCVCTTILIPRYLIIGITIESELRQYQICFVVVVSSGIIVWIGIERVLHVGGSGAFIRFFGTAFPISNGGRTVLSRYQFAIALSAKAVCRECNILKSSQIRESAYHIAKSGSLYGE